MKNILQVRDLNTAYKMRGKDEYVYAVDGVSLDLDEGKTLGIAGESGCGKSTLALSLMGHYFPPLTYQGGEIFINGRNIMEIPYTVLRTEILGTEIAYIPQSAMNALNPTLRVHNFVYHIMRERNKKITKQEVLKLIQERFDLLGLPERAITAYSTELSGGMKQRVVIAISTILNPLILIADEPTSALDVSSQKLVMKMIKNMLKLGIVKSVVYITHELPLLRHITNDIVVMYAGQIVEQGTTEQVIFDPIHPYTKALMSSIIVPEKDVKNWKIEGISGAPPSLKKRIEDCRFAARCRFCEVCKKQDYVHYIETEAGKRMFRCCASEAKLKEMYKVG
jgi:peptide/nickel transport system ATP-binding protein